MEKSEARLLAYGESILGDTGFILVILRQRRNSRFIADQYSGAAAAAPKHEVDFKFSKFIGFGHSSGTESSSR